MDLPADRSPPMSPAAAPHPPGGCPVAASAKAHRGGPAAAAVADQRHRLADGRGVLVGLTLAIFARGLRGPAITVTVIDDAVVAGWPAQLGRG